MAGAASDNSGENPAAASLLSKKSKRVCDPAHGAVRSREEAEVRIQPGGGLCLAAGLADYVYWQTFTGLLPR